MGRRTKTLIPTTEPLLKPKIINLSVVQKELKQRKVVQKQYYDQHAQHLAPLKVGEPVLLQQDGKWIPAKVTGISQNAHRSYFITTSHGQCYRRHRRHLRKMSAKYDDQIDIDDCLEEDDENTQTTPNKVSNSLQQSTPVTQTEVPLRRLQRTIRKPVRYSDSNY